MFCNKKKIEKMLYHCQQGMYFSNIKKLNNGFVVYSDIVESKSWNFFTGFKANTIKEFETCINDAIKFFKAIKRDFVIVVGPNVKISKQVKNYINSNFTLSETNVVLFTNKFKISQNIVKDYSFRKIDNEKDKDMFVDVFKASKTQTTPNDAYPALPDYFFRALSESFNNKTDWDFVHYVSEYKNSPIGMVSACIKDKYCGLYGGGTYVAHRKKGVFSNLLKFVENNAKSRGCRYFFGLTEKDSYNEKLYNSINWKSIMELKCYELKLK